MSEMEVSSSSATFDMVMTSDDKLLKIVSHLPRPFCTFVSESLTGWGASGGDDVLPSASERPTEWS